MKELESARRGGESEGGRGDRTKVNREGRKSGRRAGGSSEGGK